MQHVSRAAAATIGYIYATRFGLKTNIFCYIYASSSHYSGVSEPLKQRHLETLLPPFWFKNSGIAL